MPLIETPFDVDVGVGVGVGVHVGQMEDRPTPSKPKLNHDAIKIFRRSRTRSDFSLHRIQSVFVRVENTNTN